MEREPETNFTRLEVELATFLILSAVEYQLNSRRFDPQTEEGKKGFIEFERRKIDDLYDLFNRNDMAIVPKSKEPIPDVFKDWK